MMKSVNLKIEDQVYEVVSLSTYTGYRMPHLQKNVAGIRPTFDSLKALVPNLIQVKGGEPVKGSTRLFHSLTLNLLDGGSLTLEPDQLAFLEKPDICIDVSHFLKQTARAVKLKQAVKLGSIVKINAGTPFGDASLERDSFMRYDRREVYDHDLFIYITAESRGRLINEDGTLGEKVSTRSHLGNRFPSGFGRVTETNGISVLYAGDDIIWHGVSACM